MREAGYARAELYTCRRTREDSQLLSLVVTLPPFAHTPKKEYFSSILFILFFLEECTVYYGRDKLFSHTGGIFVDIESVMNGEDVKYCFDNSFNPADSTSYHQKDVFRKSNLVL